MESEWFILKKNQHLGPFTQGQLQQMFQNQQFGRQDQIWREGWDKARHYSENIFIPDLPPLPDEDVGPASESSTLPEYAQASKISRKSFGHIRDKKNRKKSKTLLTKFKANSSRKKLAQLWPFDIELRFKTEVTKLHGLIMGAILLFSLALFYALNEIRTPSMFSRPSHMPLHAYKRMARVLAKQKKPVAVAALSNDKKTLWLGLNTPLIGDFYVSLKSLNNKTLKGRASLSGMGRLEGRLIEVKNIHFEEGTRIVEGYYKTEIKSSDTVERPWWARFVGETSTSFHYQGNILISSLSPKRFKRQLSKALKRRKNNSQQFWEELIQKYQTVMMIADQIKNGFQVIFDSPMSQWKTKVSAFENAYRSKYGIFFTEFVKSNEESYSRIYNKKFENANLVLANYNHLSKLATEVGERSMYILEQLQGYDGTPSKAKFISQEALANIDSVIVRCKKKIELLTQTL